MTCSNIRFGVGNQIETATLTSNHEIDTLLDDLKNEHRARVVKISKFTSDEITITGILPEGVYGSFFCIPGNNLTPEAQIKLELYRSPTSNEELLGMEFTVTSDHPPLGVWRSGVDPYGVSSAIDFDKNIVYWFDDHIFYRRFVLRIKHGFPVDLSPPSNGIPEQDDDGIVSLEAESATVENVSGNVWTQTNDASASNGKTMVRSGSVFYSNPDDGPKLHYQFRATQTGVFDVFIRCTTAYGSDSLFAVFDGHSVAKIFDDGTLEWVKVRQVALTAGAIHNLTLAARDRAFTVDKIVIQHPTDDLPTGNGPAASSFGFEGSDNHVSLRMMIIGERVDLEKNYNQGAVMTFVTPPELTTTYSGFYVQARDQRKVRSLSFDLTQMTTGDLITLTDMEQSQLGKPFVVSARHGDNEWSEQAHSFLARFYNQLSYSEYLPGKSKTSAQLVEV